MNEIMLKLVLGKDQLYPHALEKQFPRIVNKIIELWDTPQMEAYFLDLMVDKRGDRQGFPSAVATEIYYLSQVYDRTRKLDKGNDVNPWANIDIRKQEEIRGKGYQYTPQGFLKSAEAGDKAAVLLFLASGVDINTRDERGWTPLMISSFNGSEEIAELLIRSGADINAKDNAGYGPMHWAAFNGFHKVIRLLLEKGASPNAQSNFGWTPLMQAATRGHLAAVKQLVEGRANVNIASKDGWTALHKASANGHIDVVKLLLASGANPDMRYQDGSTALSIATKNRNEALIALLSAISQPTR
ncbi:MAG: ankyrin repeat domain-containing protein [Nitrosomonadales bacterium]|nr:ankyrin repeat domain-containing protein [Nitrosomonadales bacterium]